MEYILFLALALSCMETLNIFHQRSRHTTDFKSNKVVKYWKMLLFRPYG